MVVTKQMPGRDPAYGGDVNLAFYSAYAIPGWSRLARSCNGALREFKSSREVFVTFQERPLFIEDFSNHGVYVFFVNILP